jgi:hypothetical protein
MARRVFFSFHFDNDYWRTQQIRNMNALEGQPLCTPNAWEEVKRRGDTAIKTWIDDNIHGKSCVVVLVGSQTASRRWVRHEIVTGWNQGKGVLGIRVDRLLDSNGHPSTPGVDPFGQITFKQGTLQGVAPLKVPTGATSKDVYASIATNIGTWIEEAISVRNRY